MSLRDRKAIQIEPDVHERVENVVLRKRLAGNKELTIKAVTEQALEDWLQMNEGVE